MGTIYIFTGKNGKSYIGQTWNIEKRTQDHRLALGRCKAFHSAIKNHGFDFFSMTILHDNIETQEELDRLEIKEIAERNTVAPYGYNIRLGGMGGKMSESSKARMVEIWADPIFRGKQIEKMKAVANEPEHKKVLTERILRYSKSDKKTENLRCSMKRPEVKQERSRLRKEEWANEEIRAKRIEGLKRGNGTKEARERQSEITKKMWQNPDFRTKMIKVNTGKKLTEEHKKSISIRSRKAVICVETGIEYESAIFASKTLNISRPGITCAISGKQTTAGGYHWRFA